MELQKILQPKTQAVKELAAVRSAEHNAFSIRYFICSDSPYAIFI